MARYEGPRTTFAPEITTAPQHSFTSCNVKVTHNPLSFPQERLERTLSIGRLESDGNGGWVRHTWVVGVLNSQLSRFSWVRAGDGIYDIVRRCFVPFRKQRAPGPGNEYLNLTQRQLEFNEDYGKVRGRIEQVGKIRISWQSLSSCNLPQPYHRFCARYRR